MDFILSFSVYERQALERTNKVMLGSTPVKFASLEYLVVHKVIAGRPRDLEDLRAILLKNLDYDGTYIRGWLKEFDASLNEGFQARFEVVVNNLR